MTIITSDMIISKKTSQLLLTILISIYRTLFARIKPDRIRPSSWCKKYFTPFFWNVGLKSKIFKVKSAVMKSYLHVLVILAITA